MKKIALDPEQLRVDSFATAAAPELRGTVNAAAAVTKIVETHCAALSCYSFGAPTCTLAD